MAKEKKYYVVTGSSSSLGLGIAKFIANDVDSEVLVTSRSLIDDLALTSKKNVTYIPSLDLTDEEDLKKLQTNVESFGKSRLNVINCTGYFPGYEPLAGFSLEEFRKSFEENVLTLFGTATSLLPIMMKRGGGHFIGFSSHTNYQNYPHVVPFTSAKAAVEALIKGVSNEYMEHGILANTIALSTLKNDHELSIKPNGDYHNWLEPKEVGRLVKHLIDLPSLIINGNVIHAYNHSTSYFNQAYFDRISK